MNIKLLEELASAPNTVVRLDTYESSDMSPMRILSVTLHGGLIAEVREVDGMTHVRATAARPSVITTRRLSLLYRALLGANTRLVKHRWDGSRRVLVNGRYWGSSASWCELQDVPPLTEWPTTREKRAFRGEPLKDIVTIF